MNTEAQALIVRSDVITFRTDQRTKLLVSDIAHSRGMTVSDVMNVIVKNAIDDEGRINVGLAEEQLKVEADKAIQECEALRAEVNTLRNELEAATDKKRKFMPSNSFEQKIKTIDKLYRRGVTRVHEDKLKELGIDPYFDLSFTREYFGPYRLTKKALENNWTITRLF